MTSNALLDPSFHLYWHLSWSEQRKEERLKNQAVLFVDRFHNKELEGCYRGRVHDKRYFISTNEDKLKKGSTFS